MTTAAVGDSAWEEAVNRKMDTSSSQTTCYLKSATSKIESFSPKISRIVEESKIDINEVLMKKMRESDLNSVSDYSSLILDYNIQIPGSDVVIWKSRVEVELPSLAKEF
ncbi:hypothetical protein L2E82_15692 [Cichorium intybus]|uniref:Uncharacterized protein n=1 Tax=Cichorium intybus TaxID=13427 RepID=A0ACB9F3X0_CICIN|nr:hypothetical protein L2E82_15692 [Cichorium intybus]